MFLGVGLAAALGLSLSASFINDMIMVPHSISPTSLVSSQMWMYCQVDVLDYEQFLSGERHAELAIAVKVSHHIRTLTCIYHDLCGL